MQKKQLQKEKGNFEIKYRYKQESEHSR